MAVEASFWAFATAVYARTGMSAACLALQDRVGADVNLLLFCLWLASRRRSFDDLAEPALALSRFWQGMAVAPLRSCRRGLGDVVRTRARSELDAADVAHLRDTIREAELAAEKIEIDALARMSPERSGGGEPGAPRSIALANLWSYIGLAGIRLDPLGEDELLRIVDIAFGSV